MRRPLEQYPRASFADREGDGAISARASALDEHLSRQLGEEWGSIKTAISPPQQQAMVRARDLWAFFLLAVSSAKKLQTSETAADSALKPKKLTVQPFVDLALLESPGRTLSVSVVAGHPAIEDDLSSSWHPSWMGAHVAPSDHVSPEEIAQIENALALIEKASPHAASLVSEVCSAICLLRTEGGELSQGSCISLTSKLVPGLVYFTPAPVLMTSESIVHEASHLWLSRFEAVAEMYTDPSRTVSSPLRPDPRPLTGLMHQVWVLSNLVPFYHELGECPLPVVQTNAAKISKRLDQHTADLSSGLLILSENFDALTDRGRSFAESLISNQN
jgi:hypothetical protein